MNALHGRGMCVGVATGGRTADALALLLHDGDRRDDAERAAEWAMDDA